MRMASGGDWRREIWSSAGLSMARRSRGTATIVEKIGTAVRIALRDQLMQPVARTVLCL